MFASNLFVDGSETFTQALMKEDQRALQWLNRRSVSSKMIGGETLHLVLKALATWYLWVAGRIWRAYP